jgi:localization factor PodJL
MLARLAEAEAEASHTYRRIEEQLRNVGNGLDNAERSQSESNRAMSRAASEITIASHEQAQAFDQLGRHLMEMEERLEKLERFAQQDGLKEAVKGLHQGLARLADQFTQTTSRSGGQVGSLARNLELLALRLVQARSDAENAAETLEAHIAQVEETHHLTASALDQALERIDGQAAMYAQDLAEAQNRDAGRRAAIERVESQTVLHAQALAEAHDRDAGRLVALDRLETRVVQLEEPDLTTEHRLEAIELGLASIRRELERPDPGEALADTLRQITLRLELAEQSNSELLMELRDGLARIPEIEDIPPAGPANSAALPPLESPPTAEAPADAEVSHPDAVEGPVLTLDPSEEVEAAPASNNFVQHAFAHHFDMPQDFADAMAEDARTEQQNLLAAARRSAQTATETERGLASFRWSHPAKADTEKSGPNYLTILVIAFFLLLAAAAGLMLNQRFKQVNVPPRPVPKHVAMANPSGVTFVPPLQVAPAPAAPLPAAPPATAPAPVVPAENTPSADKVLAAARGGNTIAETIIGLQYLDGGDAGQALPWLKKAAEAGQAVAQYRLGTMYERGQGGTASPALAIKWYLAAANQGNRKAMHNLAVADAEGSIGPKDMTEAVRWFTKAASLGLSDSQFNLAVLYERGDGVPQSLIEAYKWYSIAAAAGDTESKTRLSVLKTQLSDADRAAAEREAQNFHSEALDRPANVPPEPADLGG